MVCIQWEPRTFHIGFAWVLQNVVSCLFPCFLIDTITKGRIIKSIFKFYMGLTFLGPAFILEEFYKSFSDSLSEYSSLQGRIYQLSHAALPSPGEELPQCDSVRKLLYTCRKDRKMTLQREREKKPMSLMWL